MIDEPRPDTTTWVSTPRHWIITAAVIGVLMLLATWPVPTLIGLGGAVGSGLLLAGSCALLGQRAKRRRCGGECAEGHTFLDGCEQADDEAGDEPLTPADGPLTGAGTDGSKGCTGCVGCGTPDCIERRADGALTGDTAARDQVAAGIRRSLEASGFVTAGFLSLVDEPGPVPFGVTQFDVADMALAALPATARTAQPGQTGPAADIATPSARVIVELVPRQQLHDAIRRLAREDPTWWRAELDYIARTARYRAF